jgi:hypothetical protein
MLHMTLLAVATASNKFCCRMTSVYPLSTCAQCFTESDFATFLHDDQQLLRAAHARWMLLCEREPTCDSVDADSNSEAKGVYLSPSPSTLGSSAESDLLLADAAAAAQHARAWRDEQGDCFIEVGLGFGVWGVCSQGFCRRVSVAGFLSQGWEQYMCRAQHVVGCAGP